MAVYFYDLALMEKLQKWTDKTNVKIYGPNDARTLFEVTADINNDKKFKMPAIVLSRNGGYEILNINKKPLTFKGATLAHNKYVSMQLDAIPIMITYQLDVYAKYLQEADSYIRNLIFNIINYPSMKIKIPYSETENFEHFATVRVASSVDDNSSISERLAVGQFTRLSLSINIDDAYLWDIRTRNNVLITDYTLRVKNPETDDFTIIE